MGNYITDFFKVMKDNVVCCIKGDYEEGKTDLNQLGNLALLRIDRKSVTPSPEKIPRLTEKQKRKLKQFYFPYVVHMTDRYHRLYTEKTGKFYPEYFPEELYAMWIDRYFCDREEARFLDNKCYYYRLFSNVKLPEPVAMRVGDSWLDGNLSPVSACDVKKLVHNEPEIVLKKAVNSQGGFGVKFIKGVKLSERFQEKMKRIPCDVVLQRPVKQHPDLARLHPESVNTMRIVSLMTEDKVKIYAVCLKIGVGKERLDNGCHGGIYCGVKPDGSLRDYGILDNGTVLKEHPDLKYRFGEQKVPCLKDAITLVKQAHSFMGHFRLISWDVTIDENGDAVLIEANLTLGGINNVQMCSGPLFGKDTKKVLDEVFKGKRKVTTLL